MGKATELTPKKRAVIVALHSEGLSYSNISAKLNVSKGCISQTLKRYRETGCYSSRQRTGRPHGTSPREDNAILRVVKRNPFVTSPEIKTELPFLQCL